EHMVPLGHQRLELRVFLGWPRSVRKLFQLQPSLVVFVYRIEERGGFGGVNQHWDFQTSARLPDGVEFRVVNLDALAVLVLQIHSEILEDLKTLRPILNILLQSGLGAFAVAWLVQIVEARLVDYIEAVWVASLQRIASLITLCAHT